MNRTILALASALFLALPVSADDSALHRPWNDLLAAHVRDGFVEYAGFKSDQAKLDDYLATLARVDAAALPENERLALWINAYNACTIRLMLRRYPGIRSIREFPDPWKEVAWTVAGRRLSLDQIEHEVLRKDFREPRLHFAIVCASKSCPSLASEAYVAARLDDQLDRQARAFLNDAAKGLVVRGSQVRTSRIFEWFAGDFGDVVEYLRRYRPDVPRDASLSYLDYDWSLNGR